MVFEWDENKENINIRSHDGIDFIDASIAILDEYALEEFDRGSFHLHR